MAIEVPENAVEVNQRIRVDVERELPKSNPFLKISWIGALVTGLANRVYDFYYALRRAQLEAIPDTATLTLEQWAAIWKIVKNPATPATGNLVITGNAGGVITDNETIWRTSDGKQYIATAGGVIAIQYLAVASITRSGTTATLTTVSDHLIASNVLISVAGANESEYNVSLLECTVTGAKTLTFIVSGSPSTPATGTILLGFKAVSISVQSVAYGEDENQIFDSSMTLLSPITDVDDAASVDYGTLGGGADQESLTDLRARYLYQLQNPIAHFNVAEITAVAKTIAGVTRVFVEEITPDVGEVTVYFMRDNDDDSIPDSSEVATVKAAIDAIKPANTDTADVHIYAPTPVTEDFIFSAISPDTATMRATIEDSLAQFFAERTEVGINVVEEAYNAAIFNTVDLVTGEELISFALTSPSTDITIDPGEIGKLGNVTF